jgi:hypothetical protein
LSEADAVTVAEPEIVAPPVGAVMLTAGGVVSPDPFETVTDTGADVAMFPAASLAIAVTL